MLALIRLFILFVVTLGVGNYYVIDASAADVSLDINVQARNADVSVRIVNTGKDAAKLRNVNVSLNGNVVSRPLLETVLRGQSYQTQLTVSLPNKAGSYPLITRVEYDNDSVIQSLVTVAEVSP